MSGQMSLELNGFELPELTIWDTVGETSLAIVGSYERSCSKAKSESHSEITGFVSKLANVCAESDKDTLVDNLVRQSCGVAGFGPMVSAFEKFNA